MNNISVVQQPRVESNLSLIIDDEVKEPLATLTPVSVSKLDLTGIKGFTEKRKSLKIMKMKADTINELRKAFSIFEKTELQLNHSVVLFVAQIVEDIFNKPNQGDIKREIVIDVCHTFFNADTALVEMVLELVFEKVIKTTLWRRNKQRLKNIALFFFEIFGPSIQSNLSSRLKL